MKTNLSIRCGFRWTILCGILALSAGCTKPVAKTAEQPAATAAEQPAAAPVQSQPRNDQQILDEVQARIQDETALKGQPIAVAFSRGIATLSGRVGNEASRALAAADSAGVEGVRTVVNDLEVAPPKAVQPVKGSPGAPHRQRMQEARTDVPAAIAPEPPPAPEAPPAEEAVQTVAPPPPPPPPVAKRVTLAAGTVIPIRLTDALDSSVTQPNSVFHGSLAADLVVDGMIAAPRGASVIGRVVEVKDAAHFTGSSEISIELTKLYAENREILLVTDAYTKQGAGRGKNTAAKAGGGAVLGALIGALAGGGKGAAVGAATGGGIGAGVNGVSRGQQVEIPSETLVNFRLQSPVTVTTGKTAGNSRNLPDTQLQERQ